MRKETDSFNSVLIITLTNITIANTVFKQHIGKQYTWTSPNGRFRNQIYHILINNR